MSIQELIDRIGEDTFVLLVINAFAQKANTKLFLTIDSSNGIYSIINVIKWDVTPEGSEFWGKVNNT